MISHTAQLATRGKRRGDINLTVGCFGYIEGRIKQRVVVEGRIKHVDRIKHVERRTKQCVVVEGRIKHVEGRLKHVLY